jgi:hypothetical protein
MNQEMLDAAPSTLLSLFSRLAYRFQHGDTHPSPVDFSGRHDLDDIRFAGLNFDVHPGPIKDAIHDAKMLHRSLFVYIYCNDNPVCRATDGIFSSRAVASAIARGYVFYPAPVTTADGYAIATGAKFRVLPLILLFRPTGETIVDCRLFANHQGHITKDVLLASLSLAAPPPHAGDAFREAQDREFREVEVESQREAQRMEDERRRQEAARHRVEDEFAALPRLTPADVGIVIFKFKFPDNSEQVKVLPVAGGTRMLHAFVRKFVYPREFGLRTGFPLMDVPDDDTAIGELFRQRNVLVHVTESD